MQIELEINIVAPYEDDLEYEDRISTIKIDFPLKSGLSYNGLGDLMLDDMKMVKETIIGIMGIKTSHSEFTRDVKPVDIVVNSTTSLKSHFQTGGGKFYDGMSVIFHSDKTYTCWIRRKKIEKLLDD